MALQKSLLHKWRHLALTLRGLNCLNNLIETVSISTTPLPNARFENVMPAIARLLLVSCVSLVTHPRFTVTSNAHTRHYRTDPSGPQAQFPFQKKPGPDDSTSTNPRETNTDQDEYMTPERRRFEEGEGNLFFQAPTPLTGEQDKLAPFLSKEDLENRGNVPLAQIVVTGLFGLLFLWLFVTLIIS